MKVTINPSQFSTLPPRVGTQNSQESQVIEKNTLMQTVLFGGHIPDIVSEDDYAGLIELWSWLKKQKTKLAFFVGDKDHEYTLTLCVGDNACITKDGIIYFGVQLLALGKDYPELIVGVLAHEIGHRPKTWPQLTIPENPTKEQIAHIAKQEELKADKTAGRALAEFNMSPEPLCQFLITHGNFEKQPENYYPVDIRVEMIKHAYQSHQTRVQAAQKHFPAFHQATSAKNIIHPGEEYKIQDKKKAPQNKNTRRKRVIEIYEDEEDYEDEE